MKEKIFFVDFRKEHEFELLQLWRESFHKAIGVKGDIRKEVVNEHIEFLQSLNPCFIRVALEKNDNRDIGFMGKAGNVIEQLFVHVDYQSEGLGSVFINQVKEEEFLTLSTFESNKRAQKFYEFHDFKIVRRGFASFEENPWATNKKQLADITYEWKRVSKKLQS